MFYDWQYYKDMAAEIVAQENLGFRKQTSGIYKGEYEAYIRFPKDLSWEDKKKYLVEKYGSEIPSITYHGSRATTEDAKKQLIMDIASHLHDQDRMYKKHKISDVWEYYNKKRKTADISFDGWVGRENIAYFEILLGEVNEDNWKVKAKKQAGTNTVTTFKEYYYFIKQKSKAEWAKQKEAAENLINQHNSWDDTYKKLDNYIYDEQNIPEIAKIEARLEGRDIENEKDNNSETAKEKLVFEPIKEKLITYYIEANVPHPSRGTVYTNEQMGNLRSLAYSFEDIERPNEKNDIVIYWNKLIKKWHFAMIELLGEKLFKKIFLQKQDVDIYLDFINKYNYKFHPIKTSTFAFKDTNGLICQYGDCFFAKKENWTYENVVKSLTDCIKQFDKLIVDELNIKYNKEIYDGSLTLKQWIDKYYHTNIEIELITFILSEIYNLKCDYRNYREVVTAYLKDYKETKQPEQQPKVEKTAEPTNDAETKNTITLDDLYKVKPIDDKGFTKIGYRRDTFLKTPILLGRERVIVLGNFETHKSVFAIVELDNILASHNEKTYNDTENYPVNDKNENINDRNYKGDKNAQHKIVEIAEQFEPDVQISTSATAAGLPIITVDGIVVSGNNRIMSMKLMVSDYKENYELYKKTLIKEILAGGYGLQETDTFRISNPKLPLVQSNEDYEKYGLKYLKNPVLVRIDLDFPEYTTKEMAKYNKETKKVERPIDKAIKLGKILHENPACFNNISSVIGNFDTISELYTSINDVSVIKSQLVNCGILTPNELPAYIDNNIFTPNGKMFLENLMAGMILGKDELTVSEMEGVKKLKQIIVQSLTVLIKNDNIKDFSLKKYINEAILLQQKLVTSGLNIADYLSQFTAFSEKEKEFSEKAYYMNMLLNTGKLKFKAAIEKYNISAIESLGGSMFGDAISQDELFEKLFIPTLDEKDKQMVAYVKSFFNKTIEAPVVESKKTEDIQQQSAKAPLTKESLEKLVRALEIKNKYKPTDAVQKRINGLKIVLKYKK